MCTNNETNDDTSLFRFEYKEIDSSTYVFKKTCMFIINMLHFKFRIVTE